MKSIDAYRYFFPAGWLLGVWGVLLWILFRLNFVNYPGVVHPQIMMGGFFLCFVCGFLMTAAPKFTASYPPTKIDLWISTLLLAFLFTSIFFEKIFIFHLVVLALLIFLGSFFLRRFLSRTQSPPDAFMFVGVGLGSAGFGIIMLLLNDLEIVQGRLFDLGRLFFLQGYIIALVLGIGSRLVPALLGRGAMPTEFKTSSSIKLFACLAVLFVLSYILEVFISTIVGTVLRSIVMSFIIFKFWNIHLLPARKGHQPFWLWVSAWSLLIGQWGSTLFLDYRIHFLHLVFISGLGLMTLMIATRVCLSHGGHGTDLERRSKAVLVAAILMAAAAVTRLSAGFASVIYLSHLVYASYAWIIGLLIWGWVYLPKMIFLNQSDEHDRC